MYFQPPIQVFGLEGRYATALFSAASKQKSLDVVEKDLTNIQVNIFFFFKNMYNFYIKIFGFRVY